MADLQGDTNWFTHDRFGLFIHWGLYALPARHEWVKQREEIPGAQYDRYLKYFDPDLYDPEAWADAASNAGMKYFCVTTKHHEGFALWDSQTDGIQSDQYTRAQGFVKTHGRSISVAGDEGRLLPLPDRLAPSAFQN